jgi:hypothetical protein
MNTGLQDPVYYCSHLEACPGIDPERLFISDL